MRTLIIRIEKMEVLIILLYHIGWSSLWPDEYCLHGKAIQPLGRESGSSCINVDVVDGCDT